ncbi:hypothetical protein SNEBB_003728 [Seison nebaliae]|nr:hypothetical protein SNEBB_003728 [Seison nebaliae]
MGQYYSSEIIIASPIGTSLTCESLGFDWSELQVWDMDFLQYTTDVIYPVLQRGPINLGLDVFSTYGQWRDKYQSKMYNDGPKCKLWLGDEPDNEKYGVIWNGYMRNGTFLIGDASSSGLEACWKPSYHTRNVRFSMKYGIGVLVDQCLFNEHEEHLKRVFDLFNREINFHQSCSSVPFLVNMFMFFYFCILVLRINLSKEENYSFNYMGKYYSSEIIIESSVGSSLTCESFGSDWSELQVWDMHFLQYTTDVIYPALQRSIRRSINLGLDVFSTYGQWRDKYQSKMYNDGSKCKLWLIGEPDNDKYGIIWNSYMKNGTFLIGDANSLHKSMKVLAEEVSAMDPKIIMAPPNCYRPFIIQNSIFEAEIIWSEN